MINDLLLKGYLKADHFLVERANDAVKAWNWTTGRTRAELADVFNAGGFTLTYIPLIFENPLFSLFAVPATSLAIYSFHNFVEMKDENDKRAKNGEVLIYNPNKDEKLLRFYSSAESGIGATSLLFGNTIQGYGFLGVGASGYIMRADYQTPRKDVVRRTAEKLKQKLEEIAENWQPLPQPVPEYAR